jgi:L-histidine N-alpha-methyltransferase
MVPGIDLVVGFAEGEDMRTGVSAKFRQAGIAAKRAAGFAMRPWGARGAGRFGLSRSVPA